MCTKKKLNRKFRWYECNRVRNDSFIQWFAGMVRFYISFTKFATEITTWIAKSARLELRSWDNQLKPVFFLQCKIINYDCIQFERYINPAEVVSDDEYTFMANSGLPFEIHKSEMHFFRFLSVSRCYSRLSVAA